MKYQNRRGEIYRYRRGEKCSQWKGGRNKRLDGYIRVTLQEKDSAFYPMCWSNNKRGNTYNVLEHRLVMAKYLGRCLLYTERVHHLNGIGDDNRIENLQLLSAQKYHKILHPTIICPHCKKQFVLVNSNPIQAFI